MATSSFILSKQNIEELYLGVYGRLLNAVQKNHLNAQENASTISLLNKAREIFISFVENLVNFGQKNDAVKQKAKILSTQLAGVMSILSKDDAEQKEHLLLVIKDIADNGELLDEHLGKSKGGEDFVAQIKFMNETCLSVEAKKNMPMMLRSGLDADISRPIDYSTSLQTDSDRVKLVQLMRQEIDRIPEDDVKERHDMLKALQAIYQKIGKHDESEISAQIPYQLELVSIFQTLAQKSAKDLVCFTTQAIEVLQSIENPTPKIQYILAINYARIGNYYYSLNQFEHAIEHMTSALDLLIIQTGFTLGMIFEDTITLGGGIVPVSNTLKFAMNTTLSTLVTNSLAITNQLSTMRSYTIKPGISDTYYWAIYQLLYSYRIDAPKLEAALNLIEAAWDHQITLKIANNSVTSDQQPIGITLPPQSANGVSDVTVGVAVPVTSAKSKGVFLQKLVTNENPQANN